MTSLNNTNKKIAVYGCGGAGINLASAFVRHIGNKEPGFSEIVPYFIDTSKSNTKGTSTRSGIPEDNLYLIDGNGIDGGGKQRKTNYDPILERKKEILHRFKPEAMNVLVHSASGGSGSVIASILATELLERNIPMIVVMVGSTSSGIEIDNTLKSIRSYERIARNSGTPVISVYYENGQATPRGMVDQRVRTTIVLLSAIFSGENRELDSADLKNFLDYTKVTSVKPALAYLDFFSKEIEISRHQSLVSVLTLTDDNTDSTVNLPVGYQAVGFVEEKAREAIDIQLPIHAAIVTGFFNETMTELENKAKIIDEAQSSIVQKPLMIDDAEATEEGIEL
jgi:hypothetical protein